MLPHIAHLLARSHALGADPRVTNFGGGNTSAKAPATDPVTGEDVEVMWVKGSGGDLGTLTEDGLAALDVGRMRALRGVYRGVEHEDEMVELLSHCAFGPGGAAPSIDTAMHGLLDVAHVDHLHPDSVIALATAADGESLTKECFGRDIAWVGWRRPGFELGCEIEELYRDNPGLRGVVLGGHGLTTWAATSDDCLTNSLDIIARAERFITDKGKPDPFGPPREGFGALPDDDRRALARAIAPAVRGLCSTDGRRIARFTDSPLVVDFIASQAAPRLVPKGTSCPDHLIRTKIRPLLLDVPSSTPAGEIVERLRELHAEYRTEYAAYYDANATADSPAMRGADPAIVLVPGVGMWSFGATAKEARIAGEFYVNAINVMRGAEALSTYEPICNAEKFRVEYWALEEAKLQRMPRPKPLAGRVAVVTGAASGIGRATAQRLASEGAVVVATDRDASGVAELAEELGGSDVATAVELDVTDEAAITAAVRDACVTYGGVDIVVNNAGLSISKTVVETTTDDWDLMHDVMAKGSFITSREAAKVMIEQGIEADIVYVVSKNAVVANINNIAYAAAKADQAHQVRVLAAELGPHGIRVNGVNPDGVVRGSGIFAGAWGEGRAKTYGVAPEDLGKYYAGRTVLGKEVLPSDIAAAIFVLLSGDLGLTTGTIIPVDSGVPGAFPR